MMYDGQCYTSFPAPPKGLPSVAVQSRKKKLTRAEEDTCVKRLCFVRERNADLAPLSPRLVLPADRMQTATARLHDNEVQRRRDKALRVERSLTARSPHDARVEPGVLADSVERLHKFGQQHIRDLSTKLHNKYNGREQERPIPREKLRAFNDRFYTSRKDTKREATDKLVQKYVYDYDLPKLTLTKDKMTETIGRLTYKN